MELVLPDKACYLLNSQTEIILNSGSLQTLYFKNTSFLVGLEREWCDTVENPNSRLYWHSFTGEHLQGSGFYTGPP